MRKWSYYNENDPKAAAQLRELKHWGLIPEGDVDERSIVDVQAEDLKGYTQAHFFAGVGGWPLALRIAGYPEDREVWTGSCPCPPFSAAGKKKACPKCEARTPIPHPRKTAVFVCCECGYEWEADQRHLWPEFLRLISECRPPVIFGEQVAAADGRVWLAGVRATLEELGYGVGAADLCAPGAGEAGEAYMQELWKDEEENESWDPVMEVRAGPPHIRQRLFWMADSHGGGYQDGRPSCNEDDQGCDSGRQADSSNVSKVAEFRATRQLADAGCERRQQERQGSSGDEEADGWGTEGGYEPTGNGAVGRLADAEEHGAPTNAEARQPHAARGSATRRLADAEHERARAGVAGVEGFAGLGRDRPSEHSGAGGLGDAYEQGPQERSGDGRIQPGAVGALEGEAPECRSNAGFWSDFDLLSCADERSRRVEPATQCMVDGIPEELADLWAACLEEIQKEPEEKQEEIEDALLFVIFSGYPLSCIPRGWGRSDLLKGYGNAIVPLLAAKFIVACMG